VPIRRGGFPKAGVRRFTGKRGHGSNLLPLPCFEKQSPPINPKDMANFRLQSVFRLAVPKRKGPAGSPHDPYYRSLASETASPTTRAGKKPLFLYLGEARIRGPTFRDIPPRGNTR